MSIDLSQSPYYDDFNQEKGYTKILAVPGRVSQARETTQLQTIIQDQITRLGNTIYPNGTVLEGCILTSSSDRTSVSVSSGSIYVDGKVIDFSTDILIDILGVGVEVVGIIKEETVITETSDPSLKDPAIGFENFNEPGAHRLKESWYWAKIYDEGIGIFVLEDGVIKAQTKKDPVDPKPITQTENILDIIARRDYQKSGNYILEGLKCSLTDHPTDRFTKKQLIVSAGTVRLLGYDITLRLDVKDEINIASGTEEILREPWIYAPYNESSEIGGDHRLGGRPVATVERVTATFLVVDGEDGLPSVTRGATSGGSDELSYSSVDSIVAVNQAGTWNPTTESFTGGTTYSSSSYYLDGNNIVWSPSGSGISEPDPGSTYKVAYKGFKDLIKEIVAPERVVNEVITHGDASSNDELDNSFVCEDNDYTDYRVLISDHNPTPPDPDNEFYVPNYIHGTDYTISNSGIVDWYDHDIQIIEITKGTSNGVDGITGFTNGYSMGIILDVAYYSTPASMSFDRATNTFVSPTTSYSITTDYLYNKGTAQISWSPGGTEPVAGNTYFIAVKARKYKTSNHPSISGQCYITYYYWDTKVPGDYLTRDSFYKTWISVGNAGNELQRFGLDLQDYVNFWRSENYRNGSGNYGRIYPGTMVEADYHYYLPRYVLIGVNNDDPIKIIYGQSSDNPKEPVYDDDPSNLIIAKIYCPADSLLMSITNLGVKTLKVTDLHQMKDQITITEENLARTWLDIDAKSIPITNKKGIMTTSFVDNERLDPGWADSAYSIDPNWEELAMPHTDSFHSLSIDEESTTAQIYGSLCSVVPNGTDYIEQTSYTGTESIAPYAIAGQTDWEKAPSAYMTITPSSDTLIIPRTVVFGTLSDANAWLASDVAKLSNPTKWFSKGWTGGTETRNFSNAYTSLGNMVVASNTQTQTFTSTYIRDIPGNCRQIEIAWSIPGGLVPTSEVQLDYFIYFGGVLVTPTLTNATPSGSLANSFRPNPSGGASGTFTIPPNIPEGRVEVKVMSTSMVIEGYEWRQIIVVTYDAAIVEQLTMQYTSCRCNCYCNCWCNCYNCRGRCGTGPLAQTMEPVGRKRVLKEVEIDFSKVHPTYGVYGCVIKTDNGQPTSNTVSTGMIARSFLNASQLSGGGLKTFTFEDPVFLNDEAYAIVITGEDRFNLNSIQEVAAGRDIRCKIAKLGEKDLVTDKIVGAQPFKAGILWRSLTGVTWEQDQKSDLKFKATFNTYPTNQDYYVYMNSVSVTDATAFLCTWDSTVYDGTSAVFEYKTPNGKWTEFSPYSLTYIDEVSNVLSFRVKLSTQVSGISSFCTQFAGLYVQSQGTTLKAITKNFEPGEPSDTCDIYLDSHLPTSCEQHIGVTFDGGITWIDLDNNVEGNPTGNLLEYTPVDLNVDNIKYRHHWRLILDSPNTYTSVRIGIVSLATGSNPRLKDPRFSKLIVIASSS